MPLFKKRDKKKNKAENRVAEHRREIDEKLEEVIKEIRRIDEWEDPKRIQRYILDACEQMIGTAKLLRKQKDESEMLTNYLSDIRKLQTLPKDDYNNIKNIASGLVRVSKVIDANETMEFALTPDQFVNISKNEKTIPDTIYKIQVEEQNQARIKKHMQKLDAKKSEYDVEREEIARQKSMMKRGTIMLFATLSSLIVLFSVIEFFLDVRTMWLSFVLMLAAVCYVLYIFIVVGRLRRRNRELIRSTNRLISNLNVVRMRYANVTGTVEFELGKYGVNSSYELNYLWELYLKDVSKKRQRQQDNDDYEYFTSRLRHTLEDMGINDVLIWMRQPEALLDKADLQEVNRKLSSKRMKLDEKIKENTDLINTEREEINELIREHDYYEPEIVEILATVDEKCGLSQDKDNTEDNS